MKVATKISFTPMVGPIGETLDRLFQDQHCMIEVNPGGVIIPVQFQELGQEILDLPVAETDVWMCSYPRTGSTWAQEMVWLIGNDLDYEGAKSLQQIRVPLLELSSLMVDGHREWYADSIKGTSVNMVRNHIPHPRYLRSHLPWDLLPDDLNNEDGSVKAKVIYTSRNPKDMAVSYYYYCTLVHQMKGTFEEFCELFLLGKAPFGSVWSHIFGFWNRRNDPNLLFLKFEEMKRDLPSVVRRTAKFLGKTLSENDVAKLCDYLSFENMKTNKAVNLEPVIERTYGKEYLEKTDLRFIRKGQIGDWKNYMSEDLARRFDEWAAKHLEGTGLSFE